MAEQLDIYGNVVDWPPPRPRELTVRQREVMALARLAGAVTTASIGAHYSRPSAALRRLERLGLLVQVGRGHWRPTRDRGTA